MQKNVASQKIGAQMVSATDGSAFTGSVTVYVTGDAGTQSAGSVGSGACTHEGNGYHTYAPAQAETNYDLVAFTFIGTGAVPSTVQVFTSFPQTGDSFARLGAAGAGLTALPWNAAWDAEVQSEAADALTAYDPPTNAEMEARTLVAASYFDPAADAVANVTTVGTTTNLTNLPAAAALEATLTAMKGATFAGATDSLEALRDRGDAAWATATGFATPTNITAGTITTVTNLTNAATNGDLTATMKTSVTTAATAATPTAAAVTGAVGSVTGAVGSVTGNVGGNVVGSVGSVSGDTKQTADVAALITTVGLAGAGLTALATQVSVNDLPTNAELATALAGADDATLAAIAALPTDADVQTAATAALNAYDPPTNAEMVARTLAAASYFDPAADTVANVTTVATTTNLTNLPAAAALEATLTDIKGATFSGVTDSLEALRDRGDAAWVTAAGFATAANLATLAGYVDTEVAAILAAVDTEVTAILADTNELQTDLVNGGRLDLLIDAIKAKTDVLPSDPADQSAVEAAITAATSPLATAVNLATLTGYVDTEVAAIKGVTDKLDTALVLDGAVYQFTANALELAPTGGSAPSAADIRAEIDANSTQLAAILEDTGTTLPASLATIAGYVDTEVAAILAAVDTEVAAIKAKTDNLPASPAAVGSEMVLTVAYDAAKTAASQTSVNDLPTNAELATALAGADDTVLAAVAALNNLSSAQAQTAAAAALTAYDPPTNAEMEARTLAAAGYATASALDAVDNFVDTEVTAIKAVTDKLDTALELDGAVYRYTVNALELAPTGGSAPSAADIRAEIDANSTKLAAIVEDTGTTLPASLTTIAGYIDTEVAAILADTNELQTDLVNGGRLDLLIDAIKAKTDGLPTDPADQSAVEAAITAAASGLATAVNLATLAGYVDTEVAAIKAKTDNLPASPAAVGSEMVLTVAYDAAKTAASQTSVNDLPTNAELATALASADDAVLTAIADVPTVAEFEARTLLAADYTVVSDLPSVPTAAAVADAVWDEALAGHASAGSTGATLAAASAPSAAAVADAVWDEALAGHVTTGSAGAALGAAGTAGDPWSTPLPGAYGTGTAGEIVGGLPASLANTGATVTVVSSVDGGNVTVYANDTWRFTVTDDQFAFSSYEALALVVKRTARQDDNEAILYLRSDTGLARIDGAAPISAANGTLTKSSTSFTAVIAIAETVGIANGKYTWWLKGFDTTPDPDEGLTLAVGTFTVADPGLQAIA